MEGLLRSDAQEVAHRRDGEVDVVVGNAVRAIVEGLEQAALIGSQMVLWLKRGDVIARRVKQLGQ
jgi:hypothetical protein